MPNVAAKEELGIGLGLLIPVEECQGNAHNNMVCDVSDQLAQAEEAGLGLDLKAQTAFKWAGKKIDENEADNGYEDDMTSSIVKGSDEKDWQTVVKRKDSKEKEALKLQRRNKMAELNRLKKSYLDELEKSNKTNQVTEDEERKRLKRRKEAEETYQFAKRKMLRRSRRR